MKITNKNEYINIIVRKATAEGLSYGKYVAKQYEKRLKRKIAPKECISLNERKKLGIPKPIYSGSSTLDYGAMLDYPDYLADVLNKNIRQENA